jgi:hypothetical protein
MEAISSLLPVLPGLNLEWDKSIKILHSKGLVLRTELNICHHLFAMGVLGNAQV